MRNLLIVSLLVAASSAAFAADTQTFTVHFANASSKPMQVIYTPVTYVLDHAVTTTGALDKNADGVVLNNSDHATGTVTVKDKTKRSSFYFNVKEANAFGFGCPIRVQYQNDMISGELAGDDKTCSNHHVKPVVVGNDVFVLYS